MQRPFPTRPHSRATEWVVSPSQDPLPVPRAWAGGWNILTCGVTAAHLDLVAAPSLFSEPPLPCAPSPAPYLLCDPGLTDAPL